MNADAVAVPAVDRSDPWKTWSVRIARLIRESETVFTVDLDFMEQGILQHYQFLPGQFNMLYVPSVGEAAISIAGRTNQGLLQHTIRSVGTVTQAIERGGEGMSLGLRGPFGRPWPISPLVETTATVDLLVVAGGIGLAPLRALIDQVGEQRANFGNVHVLLGARTPADLLYVDRQDKWRDQGIDVLTTVDRGNPLWKGHIGVVTLLIDRLSIARPHATAVLTCGPEVMMRYVARAALRRDILESNIWVTMERNMNCAIGLCGHCQLGPKFLCKDGPVFRLDEVAKYLGVQEL